MMTSKSIAKSHDFKTYYIVIVRFYHLIDNSQMYSRLLKSEDDASLGQPVARIIVYCSDAASSNKLVHFRMSAK